MNWLIKLFLCINLVVWFSHLSSANEIPTIEEFYTGNREVRLIKLNFLEEKIKEEAYWIGLNGETSSASEDVLMITKNDICFETIRHNGGSGSFHFICKSGSSFKANFQCDSINCVIRAKHSDRGKVILSIKDRKDISSTELASFTSADDESETSILALNLQYDSTQTSIQNTDNNISENISIETNQNVNASSDLLQQSSQGLSLTSEDTPRIVTNSVQESITNTLLTGELKNFVGVTSVTIDGTPVTVNTNGTFALSLYIPRSGKAVEIAALDTNGNKANTTIFLERKSLAQNLQPVFSSLNPSGSRVKPNNNAIALIIGVADYQRTSAKAAYADKDARTFYDYALLKLGISANNIKELVNNDAGRIDVSLAVKDWITRSTVKGETDIYIFFAGHGLASQSGESMYLLPFDVEPRLLEDSAILRDELFTDIASSNPRSVTVFLDTCYSGSTRGSEMLIAARPILLKAKESAVPEGFTVFTAAAGDETAKPLEEAKHGMFSYFLMKGMEGDADTNGDKQISAGELHAYVKSNVVQQSSGTQTPELQGDEDRVLVRFQ